MLWQVLNGEELYVNIFLGLPLVTNCFLSQHAIKRDPSH